MSSKSTNTQDDLSQQAHILWGIFSGKGKKNICVVGDSL